MVSFRNASLLAFAATAIAAPAPYGGYGHGKKHTVIHTVVHTAYVTKTFGAPEYTAPAPPAAPPVYYTTTIVEAKPSSTSTTSSSTSTSTTIIEYKPTIIPTTSTPPPPPPPATPTPTPTPSQAPSPPASSGYMAIVDEWRGKLGLKKLECDSQLEANAKKTAVDGNGKMVHQLNKGSMGQVLAPGKPEDFLHVFVGGWLCEKPNMAGLDGVCATQSQGWTYQGQTGHADILTSPSYSKIGCSCETGIWACDLA